MPIKNWNTPNLPLHLRITANEVLVFLQGLETDEATHIIFEYLLNNTKAYSEIQSLMKSIEDDKPEED